MTVYTSFRRRGALDDVWEPHQATAASVEDAIAILRAQVPEGWVTSGFSTWPC